MSSVDIIRLEKGRTWTAKGDPANKKLNLSVPLPWSVEKLDYLCHLYDLYYIMQIIVIFIQLFVHNYTNSFRIAMDVLCFAKPAESGCRIDCDR